MSSNIGTISTALKRTGEVELFTVRILAESFVVVVFLFLLLLKSTKQNVHTNKSMG